MIRYIVLTSYLLVNNVYASEFSLAQESLMQFTLFQLVCFETGVSDAIMQSVLADVVKELGENEDSARRYVAEASARLAENIVETNLEEYYCNTMRKSFTDLGLKPQ
jgi:hypothetical protein